MRAKLSLLALYLAIQCHMLSVVKSTSSQHKEFKVGKQENIAKQVELQIKKKPAGSSRSWRRSRQKRETKILSAIGRDKRVQVHNTRDHPQHVQYRAEQICHTVHSIAKECRKLSPTRRPRCLNFEREINQNRARNLFFLAMVVMARIRIFR